MHSNAKEQPRNLSQSYFSLHCLKWHKVTLRGPHKTKEKYLDAFSFAEARDNIVSQFQKLKDSSNYPSCDKKKKHLLREQDIRISEHSVPSKAGWCHAAECGTSIADWSDVLHACPDQHRSCLGNPTL